MKTGRGFAAHGGIAISKWTLIFLKFNKNPKS
jgi:hypothetical protein